MAALVQGNAHLMRDDFGPAVLSLELAQQLADGFEHPRYLLSAATADLHLGDFARGHARRARAVARLRSAGAVGELPLALELLAASDIWVGRLGEAISNATEGLRLAAATGQATHRVFQLAALARAEALQGREADCQGHAHEAIEIAAGRGLAGPGAIALMGLGTLELGLGRPDEALAHLTAIADPGSGLASPNTALLSAPDLVEAAVRAGRPEVAEPVVERFARWAGEVSTRWPPAVAARMRGLLADGEAADGHFEEALRRHGDGDAAFEVARTRLVYGEHLRRSRRRGEARRHLRAALAVFDRLGARPWAERARGELRATGETTRRREASTLDDLTPQELQIARFVSEGATNREVAGKLFLSPRTVEYHLHKVFTKLGIASRGELARVLPGESPAAAEPAPVTGEPA